MPPRKKVLPAAKMGDALAGMTAVPSVPEGGPVSGGESGAVASQAEQLAEIDRLMAQLSAELAGAPLGRDELSQKRLALSTLEKRRAGVVATLKTLHGAELKGMAQARVVRLVVCDWLDRTLPEVSGEL